MTGCHRYPEEVRAVAIAEAVRKGPRSHFACPWCGGDTFVVDSEHPFKGSAVLRKRRHECRECGRRFNSVQEMEAPASE